MLVTSLELVFHMDAKNACHRLTQLDCWSLEASLWRISRQSVTIWHIAASTRWLASGYQRIFSGDYMPGCSAYEL